MIKYKTYLTMRLAKCLAFIKSASWHTKLSISLVIVIFALFVSFVLGDVSQATNISLNGNNPGMLFQGVGAISGGSGASRLLIDYPKPERNQILDYLFKPDYGADLQLLKIEIGGDSGTTDGAEPSIEHNQGQINCSSGYEWWIAKQAVNRNPAIKLYGLQWSAPGWVGNGQNTIWTKKDVNYVIDWMNCARSHGLNISYIGGWDEEGYNANWYELLRSALNNNGYANTEIVASDDVSTPWGVADALLRNPKFKKAVSVIGVHDTCPANPTTGYSCYSYPTATRLNLPLWESELGGMSANYGAAAMARSVINGYNQAKITGYLEWPLIDAISPGLPFEKRGLITADQPWSGYYKVNLMTWAIAQTAQFTAPGWSYINVANNKIGNSGAYTAYESPSHKSWTLVVENTGAYNGQNVSKQTIHVKLANLPDSVIRVWETNLWVHNPNQWFNRMSDIHPLNGKFSYTIKPGMEVSFTNTNGQSKGMTSPPSAHPLSLPYSNSLSLNDGSDEPSLLTPQDGSFELMPCLGDVMGLCTQQMTSQIPVHWNNTNGKNSYPFAVIGDNWTNYQVSVNILFQHTNSSGGVIGRFSKRAGDIGNFDGYMLQLSENGVWQILKNKNSNLPVKPIVLASGSLGEMGIDRWHAVTLTMKGSQLTALIDGKVVSSTSDTSYSSGPAGIVADAFSSIWSNNQYRDFKVMPMSSGP